MMKKFFLALILLGIVSPAFALDFQGSGSGGGSFTGGSLSQDTNITKTRPKFFLDATETGSGAYLADRNLYFINRNTTNGATDTYALQTGWISNCDWDGTNFTIRTSNRCVTFGLGFSNDWTIRYSSTGPIGATKTDADFTRAMELFDSSSLAIVFDVPFTASSGISIAADGISGSSSTFTPSSSKIAVAPNGGLWLGQVAFASLGTPNNGMILYCTDCTIANPCSSGGTGAIAKRLNGVWVCN